MPKKTKSKKKSLGYLFKRSDVYYVQWRENGKYMSSRLADKDGKGITTLEEAEKARDRKLAHLAIDDEQSRVEAILAKHHTIKATAKALDLQRHGTRIDNAFEVYDGMPKKREASESTKAAYRAYWKSFADWMSEQHPDVLLVADVTKEHAADYAKTLHAATRAKEKAITPRTYNARIAALRLLFKHIRRHDKLEGLNPFAEESGVELKTDKPLRRDVLPLDQMRQVYEKAEGEIKILLALGFFTAQRLGDCCNAQWHDFDLSTALWHLRQRKTGAEMLVPLHPNLIGLLQTVPEKSRTGYLLPEVARLHDHNYRELTEQIMGAFKAVLGDAVYHAGKATAKRRVRYGFHSLRHAANTYMVEKNTSAHTVRALTGHTSDAMTARYAHVGVDAMREAIGVLPTLLPSPPPDPVKEAVDATRKRLHAMIEGLPERLLEKAAKSLECIAKETTGG